MGAGALVSRSWQRWLARYRLHKKLGLPSPVAPGGGSPGSGLNFFTSEIDKTPASTGAWVDVDVSGDGVPAVATGAVLRLYNGSASTGTVAVRKNGSTDTRTPYIVSGHHTGAMAGLDGSRVFEAYIHNASDRVYLIGYTTDSTDFLTNSVDKSPASVGAWVDVDVSADIPSGAVGIIVELVNTSTASSYNGGVRDNGSTDTFTLGEVRKSSHYYQVCGVDASRVFEAQIASAAIQVWLIGCFMPPISFETNAVGYALGGTGAWTDITVSGGNAPADADGAMWLIKNTTSTDYSGGTRKNGSSDESYAKVRLTGCHAFFTGLDDSRIAEGKIENLAVDHYVIGYARLAAGVTQKTVTDALGLTDVPTVEGSLTLADSLALADAINVSVQKLITDALALAESLSLKGSVSLTQGLNLSDAVGLAARLTVADALALAETVILKQFKSIADGLALADQVTRVVLVVRLLMLASLLKEGLSLSGTEGPALTLSAISGGGLQLESAMKGG